MSSRSEFDSATSGFDLIRLYPIFECPGAEPEFDPQPTSRTLARCLAAILHAIDFIAAPS
jgi:hypothetical protein